MTEHWETFATPITVGVVSDTHLSARRTALPVPLLEGLAGVDLILHAGDIQSLEALHAFEALGPVRAVIGNNDDRALRERLPARRYFRFGTTTVGLMHGHDVDRLTARQAVERVFRGQVDVGIFGHSHRPLCLWLDQFLLFNPGSPTNKRWEPRFSYGIIRFDDDGVHPTLHYFDR